LSDRCANAGHLLIQRRSFTPKTTVADDSDFFEIIAQEPNFPEALKSALGAPAAKPAKKTKKKSVAIA
jgi:hypothetical protein